LGANPFPARETCWRSKAASAHQRAARAKLIID